MKVSPLCNLGVEIPFFLTPYVYMLIKVDICISFTKNKNLVYFIVRAMKIWTITLSRVISVKHRYVVYRSISILWLV